MSDAVVRLKSQSHVLKWLHTLSASEQESLLQKANKINPDLLLDTLEKALESKQCNVENIEQIPADQIVYYESLSTAEAQTLWNTGLEAISKNEVAAVVLAGGQASRLGIKEPKGVMKLGINLSETDSLFYIQAARFCRLVQLAKQTFPDSQPSILWLIMTSESTDVETRIHIDRVIAETGFPKKDVLIFSQDEVPTVDFNKKVLMKSKKMIATNPDGSGGIYKALAPYLNSVESRGIKYLHVYAVDNILCRVADPHFIGVCITKSADCATKTIEKRLPKESVGNLCFENGHVRVFEYSEITPELAERIDPSTGKLFLRNGSIANHMFTIGFLKKICGDIVTGVPPVQLPYHVAQKKVAHINIGSGNPVFPDQPNAFKMELFIFDAFYYAKNFLVYEVLGKHEFSPLKNSNDANFDCKNTCLQDLNINHREWLESAGISVNELINPSTKVFISPLLSYAGENLGEQAEKIHCQLHAFLQLMVEVQSGINNIVISP